MKKSAMRVFVILSAILILAVHLPMLVYATGGFGSARTTISVDGQVFELHGYDGDGPMPAFRLRDIAYILQGTPAEFDIRESPDNRWDYWIIPGGVYTPTGAEFQSMEDRHALFGSYGFIPSGGGSFGFEMNPIQSAVLGLGGIDAPSNSVPITVVRDADDTYFPLYELGLLLGFRTARGGRDDGAGHLISFVPEGALDIPTQSPEIVDLLLRLSGHWLAREHYYCPVIDESAVWPWEFSIASLGFVPSFTDIDGVRTAPFIPAGTQSQNTWYQLYMRTLEDGRIELTVNPMGQARRMVWYNNERIMEQEILDVSRFADHRIVIDPNASSADDRRINNAWNRFAPVTPDLALINEVTYYIGDTAYNMVRFDRQRNPRRYHVEAAEGSGIVLRYLIGDWRLSGASDLVLAIYRSTVPDEQGERIYERTITDFYDRLLFEFVDEVVEHGQVYYYSLWPITSTRTPTPRAIEFGFGWGATARNWQITVDVNELLGEPPEVEEDMPETPESQEPEEPATNPPQRSAWPIVAGLLGIVLLVGMLRFVLTRKGNRQ